MIHKHPVYAFNPLAVSNARNATSKEGMPRKTPEDSRMTLRVAATRLRMSTKRIADIESGATDPRVGDLVRMAAAYNADLLDFFTRTPGKDDTHV